jgi:thioredoxin 1
MYIEGSDNTLRMGQIQWKFAIPLSLRHYNHPQAMSEKIAHLTNETFKSTLSAAKSPVLVDFWAPWCGPCKAIAPILEELATELDGKLQIAKVNIDDNNEIAVEYGIRAIPTMLVFKNGQKVDEIVGLAPKANLKARLTPLLS